jgi:hypothetical protein
MYKYLLAIIGLIFAMSLVFANVGSITKDTTHYYVTYMNVKKGWNLLPFDKGGVWDFVDADNTDAYNKLKAEFVFLPTHNEYLSVLGGFNASEMEKLEKNKEYMNNSAAWYYFTEDTKLKYTRPIKSSLENKKLHQGWNFIILPADSFAWTNDLKSKGFGVGNCTFEKIYGWNSLDQKWENFTSTMSVDKALEEITDDDAFAVGWLVKVKNTCTLGSIETNVEPPAVPGLPA